MEAQELKRGNLVILTESTKIEVGDNCHIDDRKALWENKGFAVTMIEKDELNLCIGKEDVEFSYSEIKPIPLTEEWLIKFGFEKIDKFRYIDKPTWHINKETLFGDGNDIHSIVGSDMSICIEEGVFCLLKNVCFDNDNITSGIKIKYVHQLQNLYFALTGEELKMTE